MSSGYVTNTRLVALNIPLLLVVLSIPWVLRDYNTDRIY